MTLRKPVLLLLAASALVAACDDATETTADTTRDTASVDGTSSADTAVPGDLGDIDVPPLPQDSSCPALEPVDHPEPIETVGDGTAASCDQAALQLALDAIGAARGGTIAFACGGEHTITVDSPLTLDTGGNADGNPVVIDGNGEITISGGSATRILDLEHYTELVIQRIALRDGFVAQEADGDPANAGAAIRHPWFGTLTAIDVHFENNHCASRDGEIGGGAVFAGGLTDATFSGCTFVANSASNGGGILNRGSTLTLIDNVFTENAALGVGDGQFGNGGGVYVDGMNDGGPLYVCGTVFRGNTATKHGSGMFSFFYDGSSSVIENSAFDANRFADPTQGSGALYHQAVHLDLRNTTLSNHQTGEHAGGLFLGSGSTATVTNCTFADNRVVSNGGAIFDGASAMEIVNSTFTGNDADYGPAIFKGGSAEITLRNCLFADNTTANEFSATSCHEPMIDGGGNLQWPETRNNGNPDPPCVDGIAFADPALESLADNGGVGQTAALGPTSAARGIGVDCPATDQRGEARPSACAAGAFEPAE